MTLGSRFLLFLKSTHNGGAHTFGTGTCGETHRGCLVGRSRVSRSESRGRTLSLSRVPDSNHRRNPYIPKATLRDGTNRGPHNGWTAPHLFCSKCAGTRTWHTRPTWHRRDTSQIWTGQHTNGTRGARHTCRERTTPPLPRPLSLSGRRVENSCQWPVRPSSARDGARETDLAGGPWATLPQLNNGRLSARSAINISMGRHPHPSTCNLSPPPVPRKGPERKPKVFLALSSGYWDLTSVYPLVTNFLGVEADLIQIRMRTLVQLFRSLFFVDTVSSS